MLLDEPFSNLDPSIRERVRTEVKQLVHQVGITAVFVTHDQEEALSLAERVAVMIAGRILQVGSPLEIYTQPADRTVGEFVGAPNFLPGDVRDSLVDCELGRLPVTASFEGPADVMLRAESLAITEDGGTPAEVTAVEYYGHDQMVTVRTGHGRQLRVRLLAAAPYAVGQHVGVIVKGEAFAFPRTS
jgi:iron(III) transport system ATP-binding protein